MVVGSLRVRMLVREARTLKDKRQVVRSIKDRLRNAFNVSVAEVDEEDHRQLAARLEAADGRATRVERQLDEIAAQGKVAYIAVVELATKPITTEDELDTALGRIRDAAAAELADGKQVRLT